MLDIKYKELDGISVFVMSPTHRDFHPYVVDSLLNAQLACFQHGIDVKFDVRTIDWWLSIARSQCVDMFYKSGREYLFWIDSDIEFTIEEFLDVLWLATKLDCVTVAYPSRNDPKCSMPLVSQGSAVLIGNYGCITYDGLSTGLGFCCVSRKVIEKILENTDLTHRVYTQHGQRTEKYKIKLCIDFEYKRGEGLRGEDHVFFDRVTEAGFVPWLWPYPHLAHLGRDGWTGCIADIMPSHIREATDKKVSECAMS